MPSACAFREFVPWRLRMPARSSPCGSHPRGWGSTPPMTAPRGIARFLRRNPNTCFVAELDGQLIGVIMSGHDGRRGFIYHICVRRANRRAGLGRALVETALDTLRAEDIHKGGTGGLCPEHGWQYVLGTDGLQRAGGSGVPRPQPERAGADRALKPRRTKAGWKESARGQRGSLLRVSGLMSQPGSDMLKRNCGSPALGEPRNNDRGRSDSPEGLARLSRMTACAIMI